MAAKKLKVGVLFGGKSGEHEVSIVSALSVFQALDKSKYDVTMIGIDKTGRWLLPDQSSLLSHQENPALIKLNQIKNTISPVPFPNNQQVIPIGDNSGIDQNFDVIFPVLHGTNGEDGTIQGLLELANIPYVGSGVLGSSVCMDKDLAKRVLRDAGIAVVPSVTVRKNEFLDKKEKVVEDAALKFGYPLFVKPANMGSSVGVHKITSEHDALSAIQDAFQYDNKVLIEQGLDARELECSVLGNNQSPQASVVGEIIPSHDFYSYEAKYVDQKGADLLIPADIPKEISTKIQTYAVNAFKVLECRGLARVDFFFDKKTNKLFLNELNTIPGFTQISMYPKLWEASGIPYPELLNKLVELAREVHEEKNSLKTSFDSSKS